MRKKAMAREEIVKVSPQRWRFWHCAEDVRVLHAAARSGCVLKICKLEVQFKKKDLVLNLFPLHFKPQSARDLQQTLGNQLVNERAIL